MSISRKDAHHLSSEASRAGAKVIGGYLEEKDGKLLVNQSDLQDLLSDLVGQNVLIIVSDVKMTDPDEEQKTCLTCGQDYVGRECPRCAKVWSRLRGGRGRR